jgi:nicotinate-nucleotide pyrophosphorylase (carboxylating)
MDWNSHDIDELIRRALAEDVGSGDVTSLATIPATAVAHARIIAKAPLVCAGLPLAERVFLALNADAAIKLIANDGDRREHAEIAQFLRDKAVLRQAYSTLARASGIASCASFCSPPREAQMRDSRRAENYARTRMLEVCGAHGVEANLASVSTAFVEEESHCAGRRATAALGQARAYASRR